MITIIHGDDVKSSRNYYAALKQNTADFITLDGTSLDVTTLTQSLSGDGLFDSDKALFIEQLFSKRKKSKELEELIRILSLSTQKKITLWESKEVDRKTLASFPKADAKVFKLPQVMFLFLDSLKPHSGEQLVRLFHQVLETVEVEVLFAMIVRQLRLLLAVGSKTPDPIEEIKRMAPWQEQKLRKQRSYFSNDQLIALYNKLYEIDLRQKTGRLSVPLSSAIDILLLKL